MAARQYREGVAVCAKCGTPHTKIRWHEDGTHITAADYPDLVREILAAFAAIDGHASSTGMRETLCPTPPPRPGRTFWTCDQRTTAGRAWLERVLTVSSLEIDLCDRGLLRPVDEPCGPDGEFSWGYAITDEGRAHLAAAQARDKAEGVRFL